MPLRTVLLIFLNSPLCFSFKAETLGKTQKSGEGKEWKGSKETKKGRAQNRKKETKQHVTEALMKWDGMKG